MGCLDWIMKATVALKVRVVTSEGSTTLSTIAMTFSRLLPVHTTLLLCLPFV